MILSSWISWASNGYDLLKAANQKNVSAVMLTAHALSADNLIRSIREGAHSYVPKDKLPEIADFLRDILEAKQKGIQKHGRWFWRLAAEHWKLDRMASVDRNILRFAVYELLYRNDIPPAVTINEALEIVKKFSSLESASFINGLLDKIARDCGKK